MGSSVGGGGGGGSFNSGFEGGNILKKRSREKTSPRSVSGSITSGAGQ